MRPARWPLPTSGKFAKFGPVVAGLLIAPLVLVIEGFREPPVNRLLSGVLQSAVVFGAAYCLGQVARHTRGYLRQLWMLLTASLLISGAAKALEAYCQRFAHELGVGARPSDVLFILWLTPAVMMFLPPSADEKDEAEQARLQSENMFSAAFRLSPDAMAINAVPGGQFLEVNDTFTRLVGYTREEIVGKTALEMNLWVDPHHRARVMAKLQEGSEVRDEEFYCRTKSGETRIFLFSGKVIEQGGRPLALTLARDITARKKIEEALRASEERFRNLIQDLHVGILLLGPATEAIFANQAALDMFGLKWEQAMGNNISQTFTPIGEDGTNLPRSMLPGVRAIETKQTIRNQVVGWRRSESSDVLWTLIGAIPQFAGQGEIAGVILSLTNITELKRAEEALRANEELFRTLVQSSDVGVVLYGPNLEIQFANRASLAMFGKREEQVLGKEGIDLSLTPLTEDGKEMPLSMRAVPRVIATRQAILNEVTGWRRVGSNDVLWLQGGAVPLFGKNGDLDKVITSFIDITKRKRAEEALRASEERFRTLVENLHVGVVLLGPNQESQYANRASSKMFGLQENQSLGKSLMDLGLTPVNEDGTEMPHSMRPVAQAFSTRQAILNWTMGWRLADSNDVVWIQGEAVPLFGKNGDLEGVIAAYSDITKRKQAEEALHHLSTRLLQLQDEERRHIGRELHDVLAQSVMAVNLDLAQVARSSVPLDKQAKKALSEARGVLGEMSREIRTLSYLMHPPVLDELGLASAIQEYATGFSERSGITLELDIQSGFGRLPQEAETALFRIVQESLANIQRHSGSRTARIRLCAVDSSIELQVSDQGRGMHRLTAERGNGVGTRLGVGILGMRERMTQLGGRLEVESTPSGTTVRATIPLMTGVSNASPHSRGG